LGGRNSSWAWTNERARLEDKAICFMPLNRAFGGGCIMAIGCATDEGRPEKIKAMIDFTREYGIYKRA
jgi:hypothetical protein